VETNNPILRDRKHPACVEGPNVMANISPSKHQVNTSERPEKYSRRRELLYATIPQELVWPRPAIRHRRDKDRKGLLTPFELAVTVGVIGLARQAVADLHHRESFKDGGAVAIELEKEKREHFREEWEETNSRRANGHHATAPEMVHTFDDKFRTTYKPIKLAKAMKLAGAHGYQKSRKKKRGDPAPEVVTVETSGRAVLAAVQLAATGRHSRQLTAALDRLTRPLVTKIKRPLLYSWQAKDGRLHLEVAGHWLDPVFRRVPLPLPLQSSHTLALYLFLHGVNTSGVNTKGIRIFDLCKLIGISPDHRPRDFRRAIDAVNVHIANLPEDAARELFDDIDMWVPEEYRWEIEGAFIRFIRRPRQFRSTKDSEGGYVRRRPAPASSGDIGGRSPSRTVQDRRAMLAENERRENEHNDRVNREIREAEEDEVHAPRVQKNLRELFAGMSVEDKLRRMRPDD
jgi:hypothetical protein